MKFGVFIAPFHVLDDNPTLSFHRDLDLIEYCDRLGFDEAWVGEHHSTGVERISDPFQMLAAASVRTHRIRLGTGVTSLPYHHPLVVAGRVVLLDHLSHGRAMLGVGPGALVSDADMMGISPSSQRPRMVEALDVIVALLRGETVSARTDWFEVREAQLALSPYGAQIPVAVASTTSPSGMKAAGRHGLGVLSLSAGLLGGKRNMPEQWAVGEATAAEHGVSMDRDEWRMVLRVHVAPTREQAVADVTSGRDAERRDYFDRVLGLTSSSTLADEISDDCALIGSPEDVTAAIERIMEQTGGFGGLMIMAQDWADSAATARSFELFARYVMPQFIGALDAPRRSSRTVREKRGYYRGLATTAVTRAFTDAGADVPADLQHLR